jgi:ABC-type multidrug transport system fused ATPase/permease subunit
VHLVQVPSIVGCKLKPIIGSHFMGMLQMVDGHDISSIEPNYLRRHMGLVTQEPVLFDSSLRDNIAYGSQEPLEMADIVKAARSANIHDFITSLPQVL